MADTKVTTPDSPIVAVEPSNPEKDKATSNEIQNFSGDQYVIDSLDNRPIEQLNNDYTVLNELENVEAIRVAPQQRSTQQDILTSTRGVQMRSKFKVYMLDFPEGHGSNGLLAMEKPPVVSRLMFIVAEQAVSGYDERGRFGLNVLVFSPRSSRPILIIQRPLKKHFKTIRVYDGQSNYLGSVTRITKLFKTILVLTDNNGNKVLSMKGSKNKKFNQLFITDSGTKTKNGIITTKWSQGGAITKDTTSGGASDILFPPQATVATRSLLLSVSIFFQMLWFDKASRSAA